MSKIISTSVQYGLSNTNNNNFTLTAPSDGSVTLYRGGEGNLGDKICTITKDVGIKLENSSSTFKLNNGDALTPYHGFKNKLINGNFDFWQRGTSVTSSSTAYLADRWRVNSDFSSYSSSQVSFTLGQTEVPNSPKYFQRVEIIEVTGEDAIILEQPIESVVALSDQTLTVSFWAKADASKVLGFDFIQNFGTGGSPSANVSNIGATSFSLTTSWQKFTTTVTIPSVLGKTLGSNNNDYLMPRFWIYKGTGVSGPTNSIDDQTGTFDFAQFQIEQGPIATRFERRHLGTEQNLCWRYFQSLSSSLVGVCTSTTTGETSSLGYPVTMRSLPEISISTSFIGDDVASAISHQTALSYSFSLVFTSGLGFTTNNAVRVSAIYTLNSEL